MVLKQMCWNPRGILATYTQLKKLNFSRKQCTKPGNALWFLCTLFSVMLTHWGSDMLFISSLLPCLLQFFKCQAVTNFYSGWRFLECNRAICITTCNCWSEVDKTIQSPAGRYPLHFLAQYGPINFVLQ